MAECRVCPAVESSPPLDRYVDRRMSGSLQSTAGIGFAIAATFARKERKLFESGRFNYLMK
jgi:hypothetical protein